jgi:hypothetical protein
MTLPAGKKRVGSSGTPGERIGRRDLVRSGAALCLAAACGAQAPGAAPAAARSPGAVELWSWFDLPDDPRSRELSGIAWEDATRTLWAVQDEAADIVPLRPDPALRTWSFGPPVALAATFPVDLEGVVVLPDGFVVASEKGPRLLEVDRRGGLRRDIPLPAHFATARDNKSLESLTMSPDGRFLFTTTETALRADGPNATLTAGARLRIVRMTRSGAELTEHAYATDPAPHPTGDYGVADLAALSDDELLVLERGWTDGAGNTVRIYRTRLTDAATSCLATAALDARTPVMQKTLVVDLATLTSPGLPRARQRQDSPLLDNFEGLALGPRLPDGRTSLILVSDDNARTDQFARIVVLAVG